jgi:transcriptional regulator PpsR
VNSSVSLKNAFAALQPADTASLIAAASDLALLVDAEGVIRDVAIGNQELADLGPAQWIGKSWAETVTVESRPKVHALLQGSSGSGDTHTPWRHINHASERGNDVPVMYSAIHTGSSGQVVAIGRDLRQFAAVQQRLIAAQQSMQRDYSRLRQLETRYRALFQAVSEAVLIVDASTLRVVEANPAASTLLSETPKRLAGRAVVDCFDDASGAKLLTRFESLRNSRQMETGVLRLQLVRAGESEVSASVFRLDNNTYFLLRIVPPQDTTEPAGNASRLAVLAAIDRAPDALVVTDLVGQVLYANQSFAEMIQFDSPESVVGESLERWMGRSGVDLGVLMATLRQNDAVRLFPTIIRGRFGNETSVEISAAAVHDVKRPCLGFSLRDISRRPKTDAREDPGLSRAVSQLAELVGRVPLKDIVGQTTDLIEQMCIEAALHLTRDNRAAAAEMLGLSRQSLYVKLRRFGLSDQATDGDPA